MALTLELTPSEAFVLQLALNTRIATITANGYDFESVASGKTAPTEEVTKLLIIQRKLLDLVDRP